MLRVMIVDEKPERAALLEDALHNTGYETVLLKYAAYSGDANTINLARNPVLASDLDKFWLQADFQF